ncbi:hypothetical protein HX867_06430 [Pseudomonas gingeri]|uniref:NEL-type E3 ubiquitin ligase domain-containing protein n=1 Tax=Pseudomonas gingeri TaxID=117681 RepID=UPI0015A1EA53|nr:NEL-type E3 ubiquitin ligase domain-containing protein [Pseudomonas gingeri]NVZ61716.1 hypothetical protein [Pseudomonas gingeri]NVZ75596.1 hypothetical protein [Pseudomonas gingeri]
MSAIVSLAPSDLDEHSNNEEVIRANAPPWLLAARAEDIAQLREYMRRSQFFKEEISTWLKDLKAVRDFSEPLLESALRERFGPGLDIHQDQLAIADRWPPLPPPIGPGYSLPMTYSSSSLLEAALQNFRPDEQLPPQSHIQLSPGANPRPKIAVPSFIDLVRRLDLGKLYQQHLCEVFHLPKNTGQQPDNDEFRIEFAIGQQKKADMLVDACIAYLKKDIDSLAHQQVCRLIELNVAVAADGSRMIANELRLLGVTLSGICLFILMDMPRIEPGGMEKRVLVHIPNDPLSPFKLYASLEDFEAELRRRLLQPAYERFFCGFVSQRELPAFLSTLRKRLSIGSGRALDQGTTSLNSRADLQLKAQPLSRELFFSLYQQQILRLQADARTVAVPTEDVDQDARTARNQSLLGLGMTLLNLAAFANPWLGLLMMGVAVGQLLAETYEGYEDWRRGERDEAISHMMSVAEDIATMVALGTAVHWGGKAVKGLLRRYSDFFDDLIPVKSGDGRYRLWQPDLRAYRHEAPWLATRVPDEQGFHGDRGEAGEGHRYLEIAGEPYRAYHDEGAGAWRLRHPARESAYSPLLEHNGGGAWRLAHEWPWRWHDPVYLFRRLGPALRWLSDEDIEQILAIHQLDESQLRRLHMNHSAIPASLLDSIQRFRLDHELSWLITPAEAPASAAARLLELQLQVLPSLKGWPENHTLMLLDGLRRPLREYGADLTAKPKTMVLSAREIEAEGLAVVLRNLAQEQRRALLGPGVPPGDEASLLAPILGAHVRDHRAAVFRRLYKLHYLNGKDLPLRLKQRFPDLPDGVLREILAQTDDVARERLASGQSPQLRLIEAASDSLREVRLNQALDAGFLQGTSNLDTARLQVPMIGMLGGWPGNLRLEVRQGRSDGPLLIEMGKVDLPRRRVLVRSLDGYRAFDGEGLTLGPQTRGPYALSGALLSALTLSERGAMGLKLDEAGPLHKLLMSKVLERPRAVLEETLGFAPRRPDQRLPAWREGEGAGCLRVRRGGVQGSQRVLRRVTRLYPDLCEPEARNFLLSLGEDPIDARRRLRALEEESALLRSTLRTWRGASPWMYGQHLWLGGLAESRQQAAQIIKRCWRRQTPRTYDENGVAIGHSLSLAGLRVATLPGLPKGVSFEHVTELSLKNMRLKTIPPGFLERFTKLRKLELNNNLLEFLPSAIADMTELRVLNLQDNRIALTRHSVRVLSHLRHLEVLNMNGNFDIGLLDVSQMPHLRRLFVRGTGIDHLPSGLLTRTSLSEADLRGNQIQALPSELYLAPSPITRRIILRNNPLESATQGSLADYRVRTGVTFGIPETELPLDEYAARQRWLSGIEGERRTALQELWQELRLEEGADEFFVLLGRLGGSAEYMKTRTDLTRRVWKVLEAAARDSQLRSELFDLAANPMTCVDSAAKNFSDLEVRVLLNRARSLASGSDDPTELLRLARGLFRLEQIDAIACEHVRDLVDRPEVPSSESVDEIEVNLAYRVGLGRSLYLPGQPREILFRKIANVTEEQILAARNRIRQAEIKPEMKTFIASRDFWIDFLRKKYPRDFSRFNRPFHEQEELLLQHSPEMLSDSYSRRLSALMETRMAEERVFLEGLTQQELNQQPAPLPGD